MIAVVGLGLMSLAFIELRAVSTDYIIDNILLENEFEDFLSTVLLIVHLFIVV